MSIEQIEYMEKMKLHEVIDIGDPFVDILRTPNGWLYRSFDAATDTVTAMAFVPDNMPRNARPPVQLTQEERKALMSDKPLCSECGGSGSVKEPSGYEDCWECRGTGHERGDE